MVTIGLTICLGAAISMQLIGGYVPAEDDDGSFIQMRYNTYAHALLSTYQLFSGADWTDLLWEATGQMQDKSENWLVAIYMCAFYYFTNYILLNMMIALIMDNFETSEKEKRIRQLAEFHNSLTRTTARYKRSIVSRWNPYLYITPNSAYADAHNVSKSLAKPALHQKDKDKDSDDNNDDSVQQPVIDKGKGVDHEGCGTGVSSEIMIDIGSSSSELRSRGGPRSSGGVGSTGVLRPPQISISQSGNRLEVGGMQGILFGKSSAEQRIVAQEVSDIPHSPITPDRRSVDGGESDSDRAAAERWETARREFESAHPTYNKSLFLFAPDNMFRQICCMLDTGFRFSEDALGDDTALRKVSKFSTTFGSNSDAVDTTGTRSSQADKKDDAGEDEKAGVRGPICYPPPLKRSHRATTVPRMLWQQNDGANRRPASLRRTPKYWRWAHYAWEALGFAVTILSIMVLCIDTPIRRKHIMDSGQMGQFSWFFFTTMALGIFCTIEIAIKAVAHGFVLAPHACMKSPWNIIDLLVSVSLFVSLHTLVGGSNMTRFVRFLRSLRSLRLISKFKDARDAFNNLL
ncbi:calcium channel protein, partial [Linderina pennispora]